MAEATKITRAAGGMTQWVGVLAAQAWGPRFKSPVKRPGMAAWPWHPVLWKWGSRRLLSFTGYYPSSRFNKSLPKRNKVVNDRGVHTHTHTHEKVNTGKMKTWKDKRRHLKRTLSFRSISWIGLHRGSLSSPHSKCYCELVSAVCQQNGQLFTIWGRFAAPWIS